MTLIAIGGAAKYDIISLQNKIYFTTSYQRLKVQFKYVSLLIENNKKDLEIIQAVTR